MHIPVTTLILIPASLVAVFAALSPLWMMTAWDNRGRAVVRERLARLGQAELAIRREPFFATHAGLTAGSVVYRVSARTPAGEKQGHKWAYDPLDGGLKTLAHGIWIALA